MSSTFVSDKAGNPIVVYRGEHGTHDGTFHTRLPSLTFCSEEVAEYYALHPNDRNEIPESPRVIGAELRMTAPFMNDPKDPYLELATVIDGIGRDEAERLALKFAHVITGTGNWQDYFAADFADIPDLLERAHERLGELYFNAWMALDDPEFVERAKAAGFDGAIHCGNGATMGLPEYRVFSHEKATVVSVREVRPEHDRVGMGFR